MSSQHLKFVLVPGSFSTPIIYDQVVDILNTKGYTAVPTELQTAAPRGSKPAATFEDDVKHIHDTIAKLLDEGSDVVLGMSSYAGFPGSEAVKGLTREDRAGKKGGSLIGLVYIASFLPPVGASVNNLPGLAVPVNPQAKQDEYMDLLGPETIPFTFPELPAEKAKHWYDTMVNHSTSSFDAPLTYPGYRYVPSIAIVPDQDKIIPPELQHSMIAQAVADGASVKTVTVDAGHVPMISQPEKIVEWLLEAAGQK